MAQEMNGSVDETNSVRALINKAMRNKSESSGASDDAGDAPAPLIANETDVRALIDVFFDAEHISERIAAIEALCGCSLPIAVEFLRSVTEQDNDAPVRLAAASALAQQGDVSGTAFLAAQLVDPEDESAVEVAMRGLVAGAPAADAFKYLLNIWRSGEHDPEVRRWAMLGMEGVDASVTVHTFCDQLTHHVTMRDFDALDVEDLESMILAFVRHPTPTALPVLRALADDLSQLEESTAHEQDLSRVLQEGLELLTEEPPP
jgi:hypothetical protein